jgi:N-acetylglutamate synthase-like GNAT family acetyltransferase
MTKPQYQVTFQKVDPIKYPLIKRFYKEHYPSTKIKPTDSVIAAFHSGQIVGVVRFKPIGEDFLLTGMAVSRECRLNGVGRQLLTHCSEHYLNSNYYCFALSHLDSFYMSSGFSQIEPSLLPNDLKVLFDRYSRNGKGLTAMRYRTN